MVDELQNTICKIKSEFIESNLMGYLNKHDLIKFYVYNQVDLFITTSGTEGGRPVSIQEAVSFGIPVLATRVGGIHEIVDDSVGKLLAENPSPKKIGDGILFFINNADIAGEMQNNALNTWEKELNVKKILNYLQEIFQLYKNLN